MTIWNGTDQNFLNDLFQYQQSVLAALKAVAEYFAPVFESYAKQNARWTDRTGNARQGLYGLVEDLANDAVAIYLSHSMDYGKWLELRWNGRYAILWPTIEVHLPQIETMLRDIFS